MAMRNTSTISFPSVRLWKKRKGALRITPVSNMLEVLLHPDIHPWQHGQHYPIHRFVTYNARTLKSTHV